MKKTTVVPDLAKILAGYGVKGKVINTTVGPLVTQIEFQPNAGTKTKAIEASLPDIAREMGLESLRVDAIDDSTALGFQIPTDPMQTIDFKEIMDKEFGGAIGDLPLCLGVDIVGKPYFADLAKMPHLLISGTTGSGKSVGLNTFILSLIKTKSPKDLKLVLIDPKRVEFSAYNDMSYMLFPVVTENADGAAAFKYLVAEMEKRYTLLEQSGTKNISDYNKNAGHMPYIVCIVDEFADLIMSDKKVGIQIQMLAQKARAAGIHIILSTQRPSVDIVTGALKANLPTRLAYKVSSMMDSRTILDRPGAEDLIGRGDCLFLESTGELKRLHGAYIPDDKIRAFLKPFAARVPAFEPVTEEITAEEKYVPSRVSNTYGTPPSARRPSERSAPNPRAPSGRSSESWVKTGIDAYQSLGVRRRRAIGSAIITGLGMLFGKKK